MSFTPLFLLLSFSLGVYGHVAAWHKGMYCLNGTVPGEVNGNNNNPVVPLFKLKKEDWWMHHIDKCDEFPPAPGDFLELPANGNFTVELATNRAFTTLSNDGKKAGTFPGPLKNLKDSEFGVAKQGELPKCITDPNIHTENETMASGTAFAISYQSDLKKVTPENLVVFSVLYHSPWKRIATYQVPNLPACPPGGCHCAWGWIPNGCGEPNMYMFPYKCNVTGTPGTAPLALPAKPAVWCEDSPGNCTRGSKQMVFWNQLEGDNIEVEGKDLSGVPRSPAYNDKLGFKNGAQSDIFAVQQPPPADPPQSSSSSPSHSQSPLSSSPTPSMTTIRLSAGPTSAPTSTAVVTRPPSTTTITGTPLSVPTVSEPSVQNSASRRRVYSPVELLVAFITLATLLS